MIYYPSAVAIDSIGNLYIADADNNRIRKVNTTGIITSVAGTGISGTIGDGWLATEAEINYPQGVAVDKHGSIFIADYYNSRIRKVTYGIISLSCNVFDDFSFCMSPNPAKGLLTIQVKNMNTDQKVNIINQSGETVYTSVFNSKDHIIDVDHFRAGIYLVTVTSGGSIIKQKLVIN